MSPLFPTLDSLKIDTGEPCMVMLPRLLTTVQVARWLAISPDTLVRKRRPGVPGGPPFVKLANGPRAPVRYFASDLLTWLEMRRRNGKVR